jgi:uncharacterized protein (TIGR02265 family)
LLAGGRWANVILDEAWRGLVVAVAISKMNIKGSVISARLAFIEQQAGADGLQRVLGRLSGEDRLEISPVLSSKWYPFELGRRLDDAIAQELGTRGLEFFRKLGRDSADKNLGGVHKALLIRGDPHAFLAQSPIIYKMYYDRGRRTYERVGPQEAVLITYEAPSASSAECQTNMGWHQRALELCGAAHVQVSEEECLATGGQVCRYRLRWS